LHDFYILGKLMAIMAKSFLEEALRYAEMGLSVIPILPEQKKPMVKWQVYQNQRATPEQIKEWWKQTPNANVGIVTGRISNLFVIDLDKYDPHYDESIVVQYIPDNIVCPIVTTAGGGSHLYFSMPDITISIGARFIPGCDFRGEGGYVVAPPSVNGTGKAYTWSVDLGAATLEPPPRGAINKINESTLYKGPYKNLTNTNLTQPYNTYNSLQEKSIFDVGTRDENLFHIANSLAKTGNDKEYISQVLQAITRSWGENDQRWIDTKIKSAFDRVGRRERNVHDEIKEYILAQKSLHETYINLTLTLQTLQLLTKEEKNSAYVAFNRLCNQENLIEKHGDKRGEYRIIDNEKDKNKMDLLTDDEIQEFGVRMPLDLNDLCVISPGNIIVVSGSKSAGKTAFLLNIAWKNQEQYNIVYLNSEMHPSEFKKRLKKFAPLNHWKISGYECHNNFKDYVEGDKQTIYIVDYLEVHENFFEIAKPIREIHEKLGDAICFIGIQMKAGATLGRGGDFSAEKSRLYLTMDYDREQQHTRITIYDAKEPRPPFDNVRGKWRNVKIINANRLSPITDWRW
jgi:hypothetical protein